MIPPINFVNLQRVVQFHNKSLKQKSLIGIFLASSVGAAAIYYYSEWKKPVKKIVPCSGPFYHATPTEENLKNILIEGAVLPMSREEAFVSQKPEAYGMYVLVFHDTLRTHKNGEARDYLDRGFSRPHHAWIAFKGRLPTNDRYLAGIILSTNVFARKKVDEEARVELEEKVHLWTGRNIPVELDTNLKVLSYENLTRKNNKD